MPDSQQPKQERGPFIIRDSTKLPFEKHKDRDWKEVLKDDPDYLAFLYEKGVIDFDPVAWGHYLASRGLGKHKSKAAANAGRYRR